MHRYIVALKGGSNMFIIFLLGLTFVEAIALCCEGESKDCGALWSRENIFPINFYLQQVFISHASNWEGMVCCNVH